MTGAQPLDHHRHAAAGGYGLNLLVIPDLLESRPGLHHPIHHFSGQGMAGHTGFIHDHDGVGVGHPAGFLGEALGQPSLGLYPINATVELPFDCRPPLKGLHLSPLGGVGNVVVGIVG